MGDEYSNDGYFQTDGAGGHDHDHDERGAVESPTAGAPATAAAAAASYDEYAYESTAYTPAIERAESDMHTYHARDDASDSSDAYAEEQQAMQAADHDHAQQQQQSASLHGHTDSQGSLASAGTWASDTGSANQAADGGSLSARALAMGSSDFQQLADRLRSDHEARVHAVVRAGGSVVQPKRRPQSTATPAAASAPVPARAAFIAGQPLLPGAGGSSKRAWPLEDVAGSSGKKKLPQLQPKDSRHLFAGGTFDFSSPDGKRGRNGVDTALLGAVLHAPLAAPPAYQQHSLSASASAGALGSPVPTSSPGHRKSSSSLSGLQSRPSTLVARPGSSAHVDDPIALKEQLFAARRSLAATEKQLLQSRTENQKLHVAVKRGQKELTEVLARKIGEGCDTPSGGLALIKSERQLISGLIAKMRDLEEQLATLEDDKVAAAREAQEQQARLLTASQSALFFETEAKRLMELLGKAKAHRDLSRFLAGKSNRDSEALADSREVEQTLVEFHQQENRELLAANEDLRKQAARAKKQEARWAQTEQQYIANLKEARTLIQDTYKENEALRKELTQAHAALRGASGEVLETQARLASALKSESVALTRCNKLTNEVASLTSALHIKKEAFLRLATAYRSLGGKHSAYSNDPADDAEEFWEMGGTRGASATTSPTARRGKSRSPKRTTGSHSSSGGGGMTRPTTAEGRVVASFVAASTPHSKQHATSSSSTHDDVNIYRNFDDDEQPQTAGRGRPVSAAAAAVGARPLPDKHKSASQTKAAEKPGSAQRAAVTPKMASQTLAHSTPAKLAASTKQPAAKAEEKPRPAQTSAAPVPAPAPAPAPASAAEPDFDSESQPAPAARAASVSAASVSQQSTPRNAAPAPAPAPEPEPKPASPEPEVVPAPAPVAATAPVQAKPASPVPASSPSPAAQAQEATTVAAATDRPQAVPASQPIASAKPSTAPKVAAVGCDTCMDPAVVNCLDCDGPYCEDCFSDLHSSKKMAGHKTERLDGKTQAASEKQNGTPAAPTPASADDDADDAAEESIKSRSSPAASQSVSELLATKKRPAGSAGVRSDYRRDTEVPIRPATGVAPLCTHCASALVSVVCEECTPREEFCDECDEEHHVHRQRKMHRRRPFVVASAAAPAEPSARPDRTQWQSDPGVPLRSSATLLCEVCESAVATLRCAQCQEGMRCVCAECDEAMHAVKATATHKRVNIGPANEATTTAVPTPIQAATPASASPPASAPAPSVSAPLCSFCVENQVSLMCSSGCGEVCAECSAELHARGSTRQHVVKPIQATPSADTPAAAAAASASSRPSTSGVRVERQAEGERQAPATATAAPVAAVPPSRAADSDDDLDASYGVDDEFDETDEPAAASPPPRAAAAATTAASATGVVQGQMAGGSGELEVSSESESDDSAVIVTR